MKREVYDFILNLKPTLNQVICLKIKKYKLNDKLNQ